MNFSMWIFILLSVFLKTSCIEISTDVPQSKQLYCDYNAANGDLICDCRFRNKLFALQTITGNVKGVIVQNCKRLVVRAETFRDVNYIDYLHFRNIGDLILERSSLEFRKHFPTLKVNLVFYNVKFEEMVSSSIGGYIDQISFKQCQIGKINAYSIVPSHQIVYSISFENSDIDLIESQSLKRFYIANFMMRNTSVRSHLPSHAFSALTITEQFSISNCSFATISSLAFDLEDVNNFIFNENTVDYLDGTAFRMNINDQISIEKNNFSHISHEALSEFHVGRNVKQHRADIKFISNTIGTPDIPLHFEVSPELYLQIVDLKFDKILNCDELRGISTGIREYANTVYFKIENSPNKHTLMANLLLNECSTTSYVIPIVTGIAILVLILVIVAVALFYRFWENHKPERSINMVIPDDKTYRETQIVFQIENAGLLKTNL